MSLQYSRPLIRIGTRGSPLALAQAAETASRLAAAHPELRAEGAVATSVIRTTGDRMSQGPLAEIGGKGLFTKEIEEALLAGHIDIAVHSMKDVPTALPAGLVVSCILPREDPRDALICAGADSIAALPPGAVVGTASLRRKAQLLHRRPDLVVTVLRGNVETRLRKIAAGEAAATLLAMAGLKRLGLADRAAAAISVDEMLPAVAQGAIGIECRADDAATLTRLAPLNDGDSFAAVAAERAFLAALDGSCRTPIAALATVAGDGSIDFRGLIAAPDGSAVHAARRSGGDGVALGLEAAAELLAVAGPDFLVRA